MKNYIHSYLDIIFEKEKSIISLVKEMHNKYEYNLMLI